MQKPGRTFVKKKDGLPLLKLAKYLKPFIFVLILCFGLLFLQTMTELNLPNLMSKIVNVGIQQYGIEHAAPEALTQNGYALMDKFAVTPQERTAWQNSYVLASGTDTTTNGKQVQSQYAIAKDEPVYILRSMNEDERAQLDTVFGAMTWTFIHTMETVSAQSGQAQQAPQQENTGLTSLNLDSVDLSKLYETIPMLQMVPAAVFEEAHEKALTMDESLLQQSGTLFSRIFLKELGADLSKIQSSYIIRVGLDMLLIAFIGTVASILVAFFAPRMAAGVARDVRSALFAKVESFTNAEFDQFSTASLITRSTNDIVQIQMLIGMGLRIFCSAPIMGIGGVIMALQKSPSMSWIIAAAVVILLVMITIVYFCAVPKFKLMQKLNDRLNLIARENLSGIMVIRTFGNRERELQRFGDANEDLRKTSLFINRVMVTMMPFMTLIMSGVSLLVVWVGAHEIADATMQIGDMMAFIQYTMQIIMSFLMIAMMFVFVPRAQVSAERVAEVLATEVAVKNPSNPKPVTHFQRGYVEFRDVSFRYDGAAENAVEHISFTAKPGEMTAILGSTGSGKSTIANLILRFYDVTEGELLVGGVNVKDLQQQDLRKRIGYVPQKGVLLSGTIASNLRYGDANATDEDLAVAAQVAQAADFILERPEGFDAEISQGGTNVSGGQKQRLSIARALAIKPDVFIFDDSFSALDFKTDAALRKALKEHTGDATMIVVAQRVSTIMQADQIIVLDDGKIVGKGTHAELLITCREYYEIASSQLTTEELL